MAIGQGLYTQQEYGLTGIKRKPDLGAIIGAQAQYLPQLYSLKRSNEAKAKELTLAETSLNQEVSLAKERLAALNSMGEAQLAQDRSLAAERNSLETYLSNASIKANESLAEKRLEAEKSQAQMANLIGLGQVGVSSYNAYKMMTPTTTATTGGAYSGTKAAEAFKASEALGTETTVGGGTSVGGPTMAGAGTVLGIIAAADKIRQQYGDIEKPYEERSAGEKWAATPGDVGGRLNTVAADALLGEGNVISKGFDILGKAEEKIVGEPLDLAFKGDIGGSFKSFFKGIFNPCIIITACTDPQSREVNITRQYRDRYMNPAELRGYYMIAEKVVPLIMKYGWFKKFIKKHLVDSIVDYSEYMVGAKKERPRIKSSIITRSFLSLCMYIGLTQEQFRRVNGEVF